LTCVNAAAEDPCKEKLHSTKAETARNSKRSLTVGYKTILVQLNDSQTAGQILEAAVGLAREFESHLIGLHVFPAYRLTPPVRLPVGGDVIARIKAQLREETDRIKATFETMTRNQPLVAEWRDVTAERTDPCEVVLEHGRAADLIVAGQKGGDGDFSRILDFPERLAVESGRPVLVIPRTGQFLMPPKRVTVGWNARREAARALFDSLPLLARADQVQVVTVDEGGGSREGALPDTEIGATLARHGIKTTITKASRGALTAGEALRTHAIESKSDMLIIGAYGHSRLREFAFGGVTRHLLAHMPVPVLFSH
jgi:nucleotide-binding universal stress UspA family protein